MTPDTDPLALRLREVLVAAQRRYRQQNKWGAITSAALTAPLINELAAGLAPVLRELVAAAVREYHVTDEPKVAR